MKAVRSILIGGAAAAVAAVGFAAPAAAQYYPYPGNAGDVLVGTILNNILRGNAYGNGGYYSYGGYNFANERYAVDQCARAAEARLNGYGGYGYGAYRGQGARVTQIQSVQRTPNGHIRVHGWAGDGGFRGNYGGYGGYGYNGYGYAGASPDIFFNCKIDSRNGRISDLRFDRRRYGYRY